MGKQYAGILGSLAVVVTTLRGWGHGSAADAVAGQALMAMVVFAVIGYIVGALAGWIVTESVEAKIAAELAEHKAKATGNRSTAR